MKALILMLPFAVPGCLPDAGAEVVPTGIPEAMQGRWGLTATECTADPAIAKGLMVVEGDTLRFYESRGVLESVTGGSDSELQGHFVFAGEGMEWERDLVLTLSGGGDRLTRIDTGVDENAGSFDYVRCAE
ncbi:hypothetical protein [Maritimibacter sp. DP1N21-5]|uniref:hypothetical protein n=1 Tax=Maritimibacter sp. DP1N21-5 TaxID=2836867 RepID=UPI001C43E787|nr:hypothetical protein [Maritimibacter sp. DP1N21-5]MBV7407744.1 hypothetical protein [Maritimibacter sp. DP1N21-5]